MRHTVINIPRHRQLVTMTIGARLATRLRRRTTGMTGLHNVHLARQLSLVSGILMILSRRTHMTGIMLLHRLLRVKPPRPNMGVNGKGTMITLSMNTITQKRKAQGIIRMRRNTISGQVNHDATRRTGHHDMGTARSLTMGTGITRCNTATTTVTQPGRQNLHVTNFNPRVHHLTRQGRRQQFGKVQRLMTLTPTGRGILT